MTIDPFPSALSLSTPSKTPLALSRPFITCNIRPPAIKLWPHDATLKIRNDRVLMLGLISFVQPALIGRRTCVVRPAVVEGDSHERESRSIVNRSSFLPNTEISKVDYLSDTTKCARDAMGKWVLNHLPSDLCYKAFESDETDKTNVQYRLAEYFADTETAGKRIEYDKRTLKVLVVTNLHPIKDLNTADKLIPVVKNIFKCYKWLHTTAGVIHRDICENNLMYWKKPDEIFRGVLNDYDLSLQLIRQNHGPSSKQRTGTRPFMARDLLEPTPMKHLYRHDLESLLYVIVVLMYRSRDQKLKEQERKYTYENSQALDLWFTLGPAELLKEKKAFFSTELQEAPAAFKKLRVPIMKMMRMFRDGYSARIDHALMLEENLIKEPLFDETTLGGHVDFDKFEKILDSI